MNSKKIITWVVIFFAFLTISKLFAPTPAAQPAPVPGQVLVIEPVDSSFTNGEEVKVKVKNVSAQAVELPMNCPKNPLTVLARKGDGTFETRSAEAKIDCGDAAKTLTLAAGAETVVTYSFWNHALFNDAGTYAVEVTLAPGTSTEALTGTSTATIRSGEFQITPAGFWRKFFRSVFYQPLYNVLIFLISVVPLHDLGLAIIALTILIRIVLLVPSQRAIVSQRRMQELQPKLEKIKKEYAGNQEKIAQETMRLWKEHKVNPFGSCLPLLIQFPVLIALYYVIQSGLNPDNTFMLYGPIANFDTSTIHTDFFGILDLTKANKYVLPVIVGMLQFAQLQLTFIHTKKKKDGEKGETKAPPSEMERANKMMGYIMPVMIALFTASVPAGVGLYWAVSTIFAIGQQAVVNRKVSQ